MSPQSDDVFWISLPIFMGLTIAIFSWGPTRQQRTFETTRQQRTFETMSEHENKSDQTSESTPASASPTVPSWVALFTDNDGTDFYNGRVESLPEAMAVIRIYEEDTTTKFTITSQTAKFGSGQLGKPFFLLRTPVIPCIFPGSYT